MKNLSESVKRLSLLVGVVVVVVIILGIIGANRSNKEQRVSLTPPTAAATTPAASAQPTCYTAAESWDEEGQTGCVTFTVGDTYTSAKDEMYLDQTSNYTDGFSVWIPAGSAFGSTALHEYAGQTITVSGTITQYDGAPQIEVTSASQITLAN